MTNKNDPVDLFREWLADAEREEPDLPNAVGLATATAKGVPSLRMVLLKGVDGRGFVFYTNLESRKGTELEENAHAALCFHWKSLGKQVRVEGTVEQVSDEEADAYFASRDRGSQIGAWASHQSRTLESRFELEREVAKYTAKFHIGKIERPAFWSGYRLRHHTVEFWSQGAFRLHERLVYTFADGLWSTRRLFP